MVRATPAALVRSQAALESFALAPDGRSVAYAIRVVRRDEYESHIWLRHLRVGRARQLTRGRVRDTAPAIAPGGSRLSFIRTPVGQPDAVGQAWILPLAGGEPWQLTRMPHGVASAHWSPDGGSVAIVAPAGDLRFVVGPERRGRAPTARRLTRLDFRDDDSGHVGRRSHLWLVAARDGARPRQLTSGDFDVVHPAWHPDGSRIAFAADRGPDSTIRPRLQLFSVATSPSRPGIRELASLAGDADRPAFSPDGGRLAFIGTDVEDPPDDVAPGLWIKDLPDGAPRCLTRDLDRPVGQWAWADLLVADESPGPAWLDEAELATLVGDRGRDLPYRVSPSRPPEPLVDRAAPMVASVIAAAGGAVVIAAAVGGRAGELYAIEDGQLRRVTREGSAWQRRFRLPQIAEMELPGPAGAIQAWLASPADAGDRPLPTVLHVHGGPTGAWGPGGTLDAMALCEAGFRVVMPNIRGSATFGSEWVRPLAGGWGTVDAADALAVVDALVGLGLADAGRLAVMGVSYGGFLTQWLIGVDQRFAAAIAENGVTNQVSSWANSYFGVHYNRRAGLGDPLTEEGVQALWRSSPLRNAPSITTPLLILQAEEDRICPASDNEQLFTALKVLDREVELIIYPEEHHGMKSVGRPDRRIDRLERILAWLREHPRRAELRAPSTSG